MLVRIGRNRRKGGVGGAGIKRSILDNPLFSQSDLHPVQQMEVEEARLCLGLVRVLPGTRKSRSCLWGIPGRGNNGSDPLLCVVALLNQTIQRSDWILILLVQP